MGCLSSKPQTSATDEAEPIEINTVEDVITVTKGRGLSKLDLAANEPSEDCEEGQLLSKGLDLMAGVPESAFTQCTHVTEFTAKKSELSEIGEGLGNLVLLQVLDLSENELTALPAAIGLLTALETLDVSENAITALPAEIGQLTALQTFSAFKNQLKQLPAELGQCQSLTDLNVFNNKILKLPPSLGQLAELVEVNMGGNKLKTLPKLDSWGKVKELRIHQNTLISQVLPSFAPLTSLTMLKMDFNPAMSELPDFGGSCLALEHVECNNCNITELPSAEALGALTELRVLNAQNNSISELPALRNASLDTLNVSGNKGLRALPDVSGCSALRVLFVQGCGMQHIDGANEGLSGLERCLVMDNAFDEESEQTIDKLRAVCTGNGGWLRPEQE